MPLLKTQDRKSSHHIRLKNAFAPERGGGKKRGRRGWRSPGRVGSVFDERCDDQLVALPGSGMKGRVSVLILTIYVSSCPHNNMQLHAGHNS